jgi:hypothetical protein
VSSFSRRFLLSTAPLRLAAIGGLALAAFDGLRMPSSVALASTINPNGLLNGTLSASDPTFRPNGADVHYQALTLTNPSPHRGKYAFSLTTSGFQGALYLYQSPFMPTASPSPNLWAFKTTGTPVKLSTVLTSKYRSTFVLVIASAVPGGVGSFNLAITGPAALHFPAPMEPVSV